MFIRPLTAAALYRDRKQAAPEHQSRKRREREIAGLFDVNESLIYMLLRRKRERGDLAQLPHGGGASAKLRLCLFIQLKTTVFQTLRAPLVNMGTTKTTALTTASKNRRKACG